MHIKAIQIKEQLLGHEDYEVALSVGHLASLYNYDMNQYEDAERLYLRSIAIGQTQGGDRRVVLVTQKHNCKCSDVVMSGSCTVQTVCPFSAQFPV